MKSDEETIEVHELFVRKLNQRKMDFAVWFFLLIAMQQNRNIRVKGLGSNQICENAHQVSEIWEAWAPKWFSSVSVSFEHPDTYEEDAQGKTMCFYSGGVDSTYSLLRQYLAGNKHSLLTVHGMDYKADDKGKFDSLKHGYNFKRQAWLRKK
ncbi:hypothetical protein [Vibrio maerlii]|uniref:hypothetical protein n=1 Tax=Vibrio maerlii TaxID=2231648 RepID=UPI000F4FFD66|nr:hypothetical protein [Vibrio maerlii]